MSDDLKNRGPKDRSRVNIHEKWELDYWCKHWGVTADRLKEVVGRVGVMSADVARALGKPL